VIPGVFPPHFCARIELDVVDQQIFLRNRVLDGLGAFRTLNCDLLAGHRIRHAKANALLTTSASAIDYQISVAHILGCKLSGRAFGSIRRRRHPEARSIAVPVGRHLVCEVGPPSPRESASACLDSATKSVDGYGISKA